MRKIVIYIFIGFISAGLFAQNDTTLAGKKGIPILPKAGDIAIGISADPFLDYLGNMFNQTSNNSLNVGSPTLYGKYYLDNKTAVRFTFRYSQSFNRYNYYVNDDAAQFLDPLSEAQVIDERYNKNTNIDLGLSYLKYRGYGRLQGYYGASLMYFYDRTYNEYSYGNPITEVNPTPTSSFGYYNGDSRLLVDDNGIRNTVMAGLTAGVEYFFLPKISIGGDIFLGYSHGWQSQSEMEYEKWDGGQVYKYTEPDSPGNVYQNIYTYSFDYMGTLFLMFHF